MLTVRLADEPRQGLSAKRPVLQHGMGRFRLRNGPFRNAIRPISDCKHGRIGAACAVGMDEGGPWRVVTHTRVLRGRGSQIARNVWRNGIKVLILRLVTKNHYLLFISLIK